MKTTENYIEINKHSWNNRTETHLNSEFYNMKDFLNGATSLNEIELDLLGNIEGKSILHLQCHFGQDSISLNRLGAIVTGIDLSDKAIENARKIAIETKSNTEFICCDIYDLEQHLDKKFDIVFTSYGTIGWLPDLNKWAKIINHFLKPNGKFIFVEFHPVVWMFDDKFEKIAYHYFNVEPINEIENGTYADKKAKITQSFVTWNHDLSEVMNSLLHQNLEIVHFKEYNYSPYNIFEDAVEISSKKFQVKNLENKLPLVYSIIANKK